MKRYTLNRNAERDLDVIILHLRGIPVQPAMKIGKALQAMFNQIAEWPRLGVEHQGFQNRHGYEIRSRLCGDYKIFYRADMAVPDIIAVLHTKRDIDAIVQQRLG